MAPERAQPCSFRLGGGAPDCRAERGQLACHPPCQSEPSPSAERGGGGTPGGPGRTPWEGVRAPRPPRSPCGEGVRISLGHAKRGRCRQRSARGARTSRAARSAAERRRHHGRRMGQPINCRAQEIERSFEVQNKYPGRLRLRAPPEATPAALLRQATSAARINDARVVTSASGREKSQWMELRSWDPGD